MGWNEYRKTLGVTHDFEKFGCKEYWVKLRRLDSFTYGEAREQGEISAQEFEALTSDPARARAAREEIEKQLVNCILEWYIPDPTIQEKPGISDEEKAKSLPLPTKEDITPLIKLPAEFIVQMLEWLRDDSDLAKRVPKMIGTSSGQA